MEKELDKDIIRELGSILSNNTANAFSKIIKENINISTDVGLICLENFKLEFILTQEFSEALRDIKKECVSGYFLQTKSGIEGISVLLFKDEHTKRLVSSVAKNMGGEPGYIEESEEILKEFSSIAMNAHLTALSDLIGMKLQAETPIPAKDILGAMYDFKEHLKEGNEAEALMIKTDMVAKETGVEGKLTVLLEPSSYKKIMEILHKKLNN